MDSVDPIQRTRVSDFRESPSHTSVELPKAPSDGPSTEGFSHIAASVRFEAESQSSVLSGAHGLLPFVVKHYWIAFGIVFSIELLVLLLWALYSINGTFPMDFSEVPLNLKTDKAHKRFEAFKRRRAYDPHIIKEEKAEVIYPPSSQPSDELSVIYHGENVLIKECLLAIRAVETNLLDNPLWSKVALTDHNKTVLKPNSIIRFFDGTYGKDFYDPDFANIQQTLYRAYTNDTLKHKVEQFIANDAVVSATEAKSSMSRTVFTIGITKIPEYNKLTFWRTYFGEKLEELAKNGRAGMKIYFYTSTMFKQDISKQVKIDILLATGAMVFIMCFVMVQTQTFFVTFMGMLGIVLSFLWTVYIYRVVLDYRYFGTLHALSMFIILGIGSDDLFVFYDMWRTTACMDLHTVEDRFTFTYNHACFSMLITSMTTAAAFASNIITPLFGISSFAVFTTMLVMINYLSAIVFFPLSVIVYHKHLERLPWPWQIIFPPTVSEEPVNKRPNLIVRFFKGPLFRFITHKIFKWLLIVGTTGLALLFAYIGSTLDISDRDLQFYREGNNYQEAIIRGDHGFKRQLTDLNIKIYIFFGVKEVDMSMCDVHNQSCVGRGEFDGAFDLNPVPTQMALLRACHYLKNLTGYSALHLDRDEKTGKVKTECFLDNMNEFFKKHGSDRSIFKTPVNLSLPVSGIKYLRLVNARPSLYGPEIASGDFYRFFETALSYWLTNAYRSNRTTGKNYTDDIHLSETLGLSRDSEDFGSVRLKPNSSSSNSSDDHYYGTKLRYFYIEVGTTLIFGDTDFKTGLEACDAWEKFTTKWMKKMPASAQGYQLASHDAWHNFKKSEAMQTSSIRGIILGSILSFCVLTMTTHNIIISCLATLNILFVIATFSGCIKLMDYKISIIESVNLSLVGGLSVDYVVHFSESYYHAPHDDRERRVRDMLERMGISVISGAITTCGAAVFMLQAKIFFFFQFGVFILFTILFSIFYCLFWFTPVMAVIGPEGETGSVRVAFLWIKRVLRPIIAKCASGQSSLEKMSYSRSSTHIIKH